MTFNLFKSISRNKNQSLLNDSDYQIEIFNVITSYFKQKENVSTIVDVGAHKGTFSLKAKEMFNNATIIAFEPFSKSFEELDSALPDDFLKFNIALSDFDGSQHLNINAYDETNSFYESSKTNSSIDSLTQNMGKEQVSVKTLDNVLTQLNINELSLLKIDVQGNELNVLKGCKQLLMENKIKIIQCEVEFVEIYKSQPLFHEVASFLYESKFKLYSLYNLHFDINQRLSWADALFVHSELMTND